MSIHELRPLLSKLQEEIGVPLVSDNEDGALTNKMRKFDIDGDGQLSQKEFQLLFHWALVRKYEELDPPRFKRGDVIGGAHRGVPSKFYNIGKQLGQGSFGIVHLVSHKASGLERVMKTINKDKAAQNNTPVAMLQQEIDMLAMLDHPHILRLFEWYNDHQNIYMIMDLCAGGELLDMIKDAMSWGFIVPESWVQRVFCQAIEAIGYCHQKGVMHKDLKFENLMLQRKMTQTSTVDDIHVVVIDVGMAELFGAQHGKGNRSNVVAGSLATMAPEVLTGSFSYKCDVWSLGCMLFAILNPQPFYIPDGKGGQILYPYPFYPEPTAADPRGIETFKEAQRRGPPMQLVTAASRHAQHLILQMLSWSDQTRPTCQECLKHPFFTNPDDGCKPQKSIRITPELVQSLTQDHEHRAWWRAATLEAALNLPASKIEPLARMFKGIDLDKNGTISCAELVTALLKMNVSQEDAQRAARMADIDGDGEIEFSEFVACCLPASKELFSIALQVAFQSFDKNGDGVLDKFEVMEMLTHSQGALHMPSSKTIEEMVNELDTDHNGRISFAEFQDYFMHVDVQH